MTFNTIAAVLDWLGIIAFVISGALVASRKQMDIVGFIVLGTVTGIGGGTLRDMLLGQGPVFWVREPSYLIVCIAISSAMFVIARLPQCRHPVLLWVDAAGLALFAVIGAERSLMIGAGPLVAVVMGVVTASFGGIIRDVLGNESPTVFSYEIYITAAFAGASTFVVLAEFGLQRDIPLGAGLLIGLMVRGMALFWNWSLPRFRG